MTVQKNSTPIIKRKKVVAGAGHHGGAWKVAYADFVTALMAFFLLMWLLNATTEKQRKGLSDYFNPTIPLNRVSGGGDGALSGDDLFSQESRTRQGTGGTSEMVGSSNGTEKDTLSEEGLVELQKQFEQLLFDRGGESRTMEQLLRHVVSRITDEGMVIEIYDLENAPIFAGDSTDPTPGTLAVVRVIAEALAATGNRIAVNGHVRALPHVLAGDQSWSLSADRARAIRGLLQGGGLSQDRFQRVSGFADRRPATADPAALRNNRIEVVLLRHDR